MNKRMIPNDRGKLKFHVKAMTRRAQPAIQKDRLLKSLSSTETFVIRATTPTINPIFAIAEPMAFPKAIPESPIMLAVAETTNSGNVVATLTRVAPMTILGMREMRAMVTLESTNKSPPLAIITKPNAHKSTFRAIAMNVGMRI